MSGPKGPLLQASMTERFERACRMLGVQLGAAPVVVACSGAADSACALLLARNAAPKTPLIACYIDHGLRPNECIERDIEAVRAQAQAARAEAIVCKAHVGPVGSPEERAREARYRKLEEVARVRGASFVLTGHQRDDLVETSLLALARGSGIDGVAAMRPKRSLSDAVTLARPLLWATKAQCSDLVAVFDCAHSEDETNADARFPRNALRALLSQLEDVLPKASRGVARSAALLADDKALLDAMSNAALQQSRLARSSNLSASRLRRLPIALLRRVIRLAISASGVGLRNFSFEHCDAIARALKAGRGGRYHAGAACIALSSGKFIIETRPQKEAAFAPLAVEVKKRPFSYATPFGTATLKCRVANSLATKTSAKTIHRLDLAALRKQGALELRLPREGDVCIPSGRSRPVSLARFLGKAGVPRSRRRSVLLLCAGGRIAAVLGHRVMASFEARPRGPVLEVGWQAADT